MAFVNVPGMHSWGNPYHSQAPLDRLRAVGKSEGAFY